LVEGGPDLIVGLSCNANKDSAFYFALLTWGLLSLGTYWLSRNSLMLDIITIALLGHPRILGGLQYLIGVSPGE